MAYLQIGCKRSSDSLENMTPHTVFLSLGANLGDRLDNLSKAIEKLGVFSNLIRLSSIYETDPWGYIDQPHFYNQVVKIETDIGPVELLHQIKKVEQEIGRTPSFKYGPRLIDLDILLFDDLVLSTPELVVPHPQLMNRAFVLVPLAEINPDLEIPGMTGTIEEYSQKIGHDGIRKVEEVGG